MAGLIDKQERMRKQVTLREHLEHLPGGALLNAGMAAIFLDVSTKTLARWREVKGLGPPFLEPVVLEGAARSTQPYKYRKSDLELFVSARMRSGGFAFANDLQPWQLDGLGLITGNALDLQSAEDLLDTDPYVATLLEALTGNWSSADSMHPYRDELESGMRDALAVVDSSLQRQQLDERTPRAPSSPKPRDL